MSKRSNHTEHGSQTDRLAQLIAVYTPHDGGYDLPIPGLRAFKISKIEESPKNIVNQPGICIVAQGTKRVVLGECIYEYDKSKFVVYSMALPVEAHVIQASRHEPYFCLTLDINQQRIAELAQKVFPRGIPKIHDLRSIHIGQSDEKIVAAAVRMLELMESPRAIMLLSETIYDEVYIRLLVSPLGAAVAQIGAVESYTWKITKAVSWIRENYTETIHIDELAKLVNMSESSFHRHFKSATMMSPVQFQKMLRLQEAKSLMLLEMMDVATASQAVGYASSSQFSREYTRFFGTPPARDITNLRTDALSLVPS